MGMALVTKHTSLVTVEEEQGSTIFARSFRSKSLLTSCTLLTRQSASVLKVGMPCALQS